MERRRLERQAQRMSLRLGVALIVALCLALGFSDTTSAMPGLGGGVNPDVTCSGGYDPNTATCINQSTSGQSGGGTKPRSGPATGGPQAGKSKPGGATTCTAKDPTTGKSVTGPISSKPVPNPPPPSPDQGPGQWKYIYCGGVLLHMEWVENAYSGPADSASRIAHDIKLITFPTPHIHLNPDPATAGDQIVGVEMWMWVDGTDLTMNPSVTNAPPVVTTATFSTPGVSFDTGDGTVVNCPGSGTPWTPGATSSNCSHTYTKSSAGRQGDVYTVIATVNWTVTWTDGTNGGVIGPIPQQSRTTIRVAEGQAINSR